MKHCSKDITVEEIYSQYQSERHDIIFLVSPALREWGSDARSMRDVITALCAFCYSDATNKPVYGGELDLMLLLGCSPATAVKAKRRLVQAGLWVQLGRLLRQQGLMSYNDGKPQKMPVYLFMSGLFSMLGGPLQKAVARMAVCDGIAVPNAVRATFLSWENRCDEFTRQVCRAEDRCLHQDGLRFIPADKLKRYSRQTREKLHALGMLERTQDFLNGPVEPGAILILNPLKAPDEYARFMKEEFLPRAEKHELMKQADRDRRAAHSGL